MSSSSLFIRRQNRTENITQFRAVFEPWHTTVRLDRYGGGGGIHRPALPPPLPYLRLRSSLPLVPVARQSTEIKRASSRTPQAPGRTYLCFVAAAVEEHPVAGRVPNGVLVDVVLLSPETKADAVLSSLPLPQVSISCPEGKQRLGQVGTTDKLAGNFKLFVRARWPSAEVASSLTNPANYLPLWSSSADGHHHHRSTWVFGSVSCFVKPADNGGSACLPPWCCCGSSIRRSRRYQSLPRGCACRCCRKPRRSRWSGGRRSRRVRCPPRGCRTQPHCRGRGRPQGGRNNYNPHTNFSAQS